MVDKRNKRRNKEEKISQYKEKKCTKNEDREEYEKQYEKQKYKTQMLIKEEITKYEKKITEDIMRNPNTRIWETIKTLQGKKKHENRKQEIYDNNQVIISEEEWSQQIETFWNTIY